MSNVGKGLAALAVSGFSGSGKTTLLEKVVPLLRDRGLAVAVVKHDAHGVDLDRPGKDSDRLFRAGADVVLQGPNETAVRWHPANAPQLVRVLERSAANHDLVLVEGHRDTALPKLWLLDDGAKEPPSEVIGIRRVLEWSEPRVPVAVDEILQFLDEVWCGRQLQSGLLIGGRSTRMGQPKQLLERDGRSFVERVAEVLAGVVCEPVLLGDGPVPQSLAGLSRLADPPGPSGPMAGLLAALRWDPRAAWLVLACDQPLVEPAAVEWLVAERRPGRWAVLPRTAEGPVEPCFAVYEPQAAWLLEDALAAGAIAPSGLADHPKVASPEVPPDLAHCWRSINTPEECESLGR